MVVPSLAIVAPVPESVQVSGAADVPAVQDSNDAFVIRFAAASKPSPPIAFQDVPSKILVVFVVVL